MALGDTGGDDDALPPLEELSGADASPRNGAGARGYDFDREDRRRGVRGAGTMRRLCYIDPAATVPRGPDALSAGCPRRLARGGSGTARYMPRAVR